MFDALNAAAVKLQNIWFRARDQESGQTLVEYALIIAIVALGSVVALGFLSGKIQNLFNTAGSQLNDVPG